MHAPYKFNQDLEISEYNKKNLKKWAVCQNSNRIPLWVADMDFKVAPKIQEAIIEQAKEGHFGYFNAPNELYELVISRLKNLYQWDIAKEDIFWSPGMVPLLNIICRTFTGDAGKVIIPVPVYYNIIDAPKFGGIQSVQVPLVKDSNNLFDFDWIKIEEEMKSGAKIFILCNPLNPGGMVLRKWQLEKLAKLCLDYNVLICSDEIHCDHILEKDLKHIPIASLSPEVANITFTLMSPTKAFNIAGLKISYCISSNQVLLEKLVMASRGILSDVNAVGYKAAIAAYRYSNDWLQELLVRLRKNRDVLYEFFDGHRYFEMQTPHEATYLAWIKIKNIEPEIAFQKLYEIGLEVSKGKLFAGHGYVRMNFGCHASTLKEVLARIGRAFY